MNVKSPASAGLFCVVGGQSHSAGEWKDLAGSQQPGPRSPFITSTAAAPTRMHSPEPVIAGAIDAVTSGTDVDIVGVRMSGRSRAAGIISAHFRGEGWQVLDAAPDAIRARTDAPRSLIVADNWEHLDFATWAAVQGAAQDHGAVLVVTRAGSVGGRTPFAGDHASLEVPTLDAPALRVLLTRVFGFVLDEDAVDALVVLSGGAVGAAVSLVSAALDAGTLTVDGGRGRIGNPGIWVATSAPTVRTLLEPLSERQRDVLAKIGALGKVATLAPVLRSAAEAAVGDGALEELTGLGYISALPDQAVSLTSPLLAAHFSRSF